MGIFGANVNKMIKKGDYKGLAKVVRNGLCSEGKEKLETLKAAEALARPCFKHVIPRSDKQYVVDRLRKVHNCFIYDEYIKERLEYEVNIDVNDDADQIMRLLGRRKYYYYPELYLCVEIALHEWESDLESSDAPPPA